nr:MAG TPA: acyl-CoA binding domain containing protein [Caudoviricetes sp.]
MHKWNTWSKEKGMDYINALESISMKYIPIFIKGSLP